MEVCSYAQANRTRFVAELRRFLTFPSVSSGVEHKADVLHCARWLARHLIGVGLPWVRLVLTRGHPIVYAQSEPRPGRPTVLVYGHYDVVPPGPAAAWDSPPFRPAARGDYLIARGASDDKGQMFIHLKALESFRRTTGRLPLNVKCLFDGEEEVGSPHVLRFLSRHRELLRADCVVVSDGPMVSRDRPAIVYGLRGLLNLELDVHGPSQDIHSGTFGGVVHNPGQALCEIVARLHTPHGRVAIPGFYNRVLNVSDRERGCLASAGRRFGQSLRALGISAAWGEAGYTPYERTVLRPALIVNLLGIGDSSRGDGSIIPAIARAQLQFRLVPDQEPAEVERLTHSYIARIAPQTVVTAVRVVTPSALPVLADSADPAVQCAASAYRRAFGRVPLFLRSGGTIPAVSAFQHVLGIPVVLMGFGLPDDSPHGPNEKLYLPNFYKGIDTSLHFMAQLGTQGVHGRYAGTPRRPRLRHCRRTT